MLAGNTRDEAKLFPTFLALSPALGGVSGRLVNDTQLFAIHSATTRTRRRRSTIEQWIPAAYLPVTTPVTGFNARDRLLNQIFFVASRDHMLDALKTQQNEVWYYRFDWDEEPAPLNDIYGAAHAFDLPFIFGTFGPSLFSNFANSTANRPGRLTLSRRDDGKHRRVRVQRRSERAGARHHLADLAVEADLRRHADGQGDHGGIAYGARPVVPHGDWRADAGRAVQPCGRVGRLVLRHWPDADRPR